MKLDYLSKFLCILFCLFHLCSIISVVEIFQLWLNIFFFVVVETIANGITFLISISNN